MSKGILFIKSSGTASILGIVALVLICLSENQTDSIRNLVRESFVPGYEIITWIDQTTTKRDQKNAKSKNNNKQTEINNITLKKEMDLLKSRFLKLKSQNIDLKNQIGHFQNNGKPIYKGKETEPLFVPNLIDARILGKEITSKPYAKQILKIGSKDGISKENMVLEAEYLLVDQGKHEGISAEQFVLTGRTLIGRISQAGMHTSTLQIITDPNFRSKVHVYPADYDEATVVAEGVLTGSKDKFCLLKYVPTTQAISVGDDIYTADTNEILPSPVYIGKIIEATHKHDEQFWTIKVKPAMKDRSPKTVQILRTIPNPKRLAAKLEP